MGISFVIAGLDPAIHPLRRNFAKVMDARVKPGHDELFLLTRLRLLATDCARALL